MKPLSNIKFPIRDISSANELTSPDDTWTGAVVFLFVEEHVLFIKRSESMPTHKGQIAFVGGHRNEGEGIFDTAAREFWEETGLGSSQLRFHGCLDEVKTSSKSVIVPVVCSINMKPEDFIQKIKSNGEWSEALLLPFSLLQDSSRWTFANSILRDSEGLIKFYPIMRETYISHSGDCGKDHLLWGATAKMIWNLFKFYGEDAK